MGTGAVGLEGVDACLDVGRFCLGVTVVGLCTTVAPLEATFAGLGAIGAGFDAAVADLGAMAEGLSADIGCLGAPVTVLGLALRGSPVTAGEVVGTATGTADVCKGRQWSPPASLATCASTVS